MTMVLQIFAVDGIGEVVAHDDIAEIIVNSLEAPLMDGDVVVVTSKIVSKAAGLATTTDREIVIAEETDRIVARRGQTRIVRTHHGLTLAAAGIDASNIELGQIIPLPREPDRDARELRQRLKSLAQVDLAVIITDTAGRAWRIGQIDIAIGAAGIRPNLDFAGVEDSYGNVLAVTSPAIADEIAGAADLVAEKLGGNPVVIVRGIPAEWLLPDGDAGASALIRDEDGDLFGLGARDAVIAATSDEESPRGFPLDSESSVEELLDAARIGVDANAADIRILPSGNLQVYPKRPDPGQQDWLAMGALAERLRILAKAMRIPCVVVFGAHNAVVE